MITPAYSVTATERILPRLALNFTTAALDSRVTISRALNTATRINSSGFIETVNADLPRFDYSPVNVGISKGLLIEETRSNFVLQSSALDVSWALDEMLAFGSGSVINATTSPDGTVNADLIVPNTNSSSTHRVRQTVTTAAVAHTVSFFAKPAGYSKVGFREGQVTGAFATFDLLSGQVISQGTGGTGSIENAGNGWYRCSILFTAGAAARLDIFPLPDNYVSGNPLFTYSGDGTSGIYLWGVQLEAGAFATSYIPTTTTSLTRNADIVTMTGTNFSDWFNASAGTFVASWDISAFDSNRRGVWGISDAGTQRLALRAADISSINYPIGVVGTGSGVVALSGTTYATNTFIRAALAYGSNMAYSQNGAAPVTNASAASVAGSSIYLGSSANVGLQLCGHIYSLYYYNQRIIDAETQAFSKL